MLTCAVEISLMHACETLLAAQSYRACSAGYKPTLLQLFGLLQLQSIERKIL
jgi:hypothetical protein